MTKTVMMPSELTAENGAKGLLSGEFHELFMQGCPCCDSTGYLGANDTEQCDNCNGEGAVAYKVPVSWTTIKEIYVTAVKHLAT